MLINKAMKNYVPSERKTKQIVTVILVLSLALALMFIVMFYMVMRTSNHYKLDEEYRQVTYDIVRYTDNITICINDYIISAGNSYCDNVNDLIDDRNESIEKLISLGISEGKMKLIETTFEIIEEVTIVEDEAMKLVDEGNNLAAMDLINSEDYQSKVKLIHDNFDVLHLEVNDKLTVQGGRTVLWTFISLLSTVFITFITSCCALMLLYNYRQLKKLNDIDQLTGLLNRNNLNDKIKDIIYANPEKYGALIYCDIDNLKFINECYGHRNGDKYIQAAADSLKSFGEYDSCLARIAGDEFIIYIHGFESKVELVKIIKDKIDNALERHFTTSFNAQEKVRFTSGVAIYPTDASTVDDLQKFADYAMLKTKKSSKGEIAFYDKGEIDRSTFLLANKGHLDKFLEIGILDFALQPIVFADSFEIYGYEALMRPDYGVITNPLVLLQLAKEESKLDKLERFVVKNVVEKIIANVDKFDDCKIFVNTIADRMLTEEELQQYAYKYPELFTKLVVEITEQEYVDPDVLKEKTNRLKGFGALIALDDYGAGYSNEFTLLSGLYDLIKIDMKIVRGIDKDPKRKEIVKSIIKIAKINDYKVLAEGVETEEEVVTLRKLGVDYFQGYYFGKPDLEVKPVNPKALELLKKLI